MTDAPDEQTETELQLCNCDGFWHIECPDGVTRYVSEKSLAEYGRQQTEDAQNELIGYVHRELGAHDIADQMKKYQLAAAQARVREGKQ